MLDLHKVAPMMMMATRKRRRFFTLLEVMVGIALLTLASGVIGWRMHKAIQKKKFQSGIERLKERFFICQRLAVATQDDWTGEFKQKEKDWVFELSCIDGKIKKLPTLTLEGITIALNGKKVSELDFEFYSSGQVVPEGVLRFSQDSLQEEWKISEIFQREEGKKLGPFGAKS